MAKSERVEASIEEVFSDDAEFTSEVESIRDAAHEAARFIRDLRVAGGLTQRELATRLGISQPRVSAMERGLGPEGPTYLMLKRVARACGAGWSLETGLGAPAPRAKFVSRNELASLIASKANLSKTVANNAVGAVFESIAGALKGGSEVRLAGFGTFSLAAGTVSEVPTPRSRDKPRIAASRRAKFTPGKRLREQLN